VARTIGVRLLGPNSIGIINVGAGLTLSANAMLELPEIVPGNTAVISQSGSLIGALLSHGAARDLGFSKLVSVGNEADLTVGEIGSLLLDDDATHVILLFLETLRDRERIAAFARQAHKVGKPVIAYRVGRSAIGQRLAQSHTGALASSDAVLGTFLAHHGIAEVNMFDSLIESSRLFVARQAPAIQSRASVAVVTTTGGGGAMIVDNLSFLGLDIARIPKSVTERMLAQGVTQESERMLDLTMAGAKPDIVRGVINDLMADAAIDAVIMVVGSSARFHPDIAVDPLMEISAAKKPFAVYLVPDAEVSLHRLARAGVPVFRTPETCADAIHSLLRWRSPTPPTPPTRVKISLDDLVKDRWAPGGLEALAVFSGLRIPVADGGIARNPDDAESIAARIGYPVALKIASVDIAHKSESGGVCLNITDAKMLARAHASLMQDVAAAAPGARIDGALVQKMEQGLAEVLVGYQRDPVAGPIVMLGLGGVLAELYRDTSTRMAPVAPQDARQMIDEVIGLAPVRGYRNLPRGDLSALTQVVCAVSTLAFEERILEAEINPLIVKAEGEGVIAVDGLIVCQEPPNTGA
jgi:acyl-CoA synthetase (NDP forming)